MIGRELRRQVLGTVPERLEPGALLTVTEALLLVPVSRAELYRLIHAGIVPAVRFPSSGRGRGRVFVWRVGLETLIRTLPSAADNDPSTSPPSREDLDQIIRRVEGT